MANEKSRFEINGTSYDLHDAKAVKFDRTQSLTSAQKQKARENIGAGSADDVAGKLDKANVYNGHDKTEAGYALDARQGKALADKLDATQSDIAIIIEGNQTTHTGGVAVGEYVIVRNSTISGITDGLYKAVQAIPANTAITSAYLEAVDGGGLNALNASIIPNYSDLLFNGQIDNNPYTATKKCYFVAIAVSSNTVIRSYSVMVNNFDVSVVDSSGGPQAGVLFASGYLNPGDVLSGHAKVKVFGLT